MADKEPKRGKLVFKPVPPKTRGGATSEYVDLVEEFIASGQDAAAIEGLPTKQASIAIGLNKAIERLGVGDKVEVTRRTVEVYLERIAK